MRREALRERASQRAEQRRAQQRQRRSHADARSSAASAELRDARPIVASRSAAHPARRPRRARPGLHPRDAAAASGCSRASTSAPRCAGSKHPRGGAGAAGGQPLGRQRTPDTTVFTLAFNTYFGVERRFFQLAHNLVLAMPGLGYLRKYGTVAASPENATRRCARAPPLLVYPGGDYEVHRPTWESATRSTSTAARASSGSRSRRTCRSCPSWRSAARRRRCS